MRVNIFCFLGRIAASTTCIQSSLNATQPCYVNDKEKKKERNFFCKQNQHLVWKFFNSEFHPGCSN